MERVITLSRGSVAQAAEDLLEIGSATSGHVYGRIPLLPEPVPSAAAWPLRVTARRGIRRMLRAAGRVDLLHLRMADVGSLAAADVARELGIPVVFTVAPDPHAVIHSLDRSGALTREHFGEIDLREHFWFRARLVQNLASNAAHTVLFPRPQLQRDMSAARRHRHHLAPRAPHDRRRRRRPRRRRPRGRRRRATTPAGATRARRARRAARTDRAPARASGAACRSS